MNPVSKISVIMGITCMACSTAHAPPRPVSLHETVRDENLDVTPTRFSCRLDSEHEGITMCNVVLDVHNRGQSPITVTKEAQTANLDWESTYFSMVVTPEGRALAAFPQAFGGDPPAILPDEVAEVYMIFGLATTHPPHSFEFHETDGSRGVLVQES
jgi:hypothetical protein